MSGLTGRIWTQHLRSSAGARLPATPHDDGQVIPLSSGQKREHTELGRVAKCAEDLKTARCRRGPSGFRKTPLKGRSDEPDDQRTSSGRDAGTS